jgi:hypothetical protein
MRRIAFIASFAALAVAASAEARVSAALPGVAATSDRVTVRGQAPRWATVVLEQRAGGRWRARARARGGRYSLVWHTPSAPGVAALRVVALRDGRRVGASRVRRVAVSAVEVLRPSRVVHAPAPGEAGTLRYAGRVPAAAGEYVALDAGPATPHGLLARVVARRVEGGRTVLRTTPASIVEAVPEGRIAIGSLRAARATGTPRAFRSALDCGSGPAAELDGSLDASLDPRFELDWSRGRVRSVRAAVTLTGDARLLVRVGGRASCALAETAVARWDAPPLRFAVGPIPVVIVPRTDLYVAADAEAGAAVEAGVEGALTARAGLRYDGEVQPTGSFTHSFAPIAPAGRVDAAIAARVTPSVTFLMYGQAGPRIDLSTGLRLDATSAGDPWWRLSAPVELSAGLRVPRFTGLEIPPRTVFERSFTIAQAEPGGAPAEPRRRASAAWDSSRTDVDLHVWDADGNHAWFGDKAAIPGALLSTDDTDGFGPEFFDETGSTTRGYSYGLCYFDDHGLGATAVTVRIDGRESTHRLGASGDSAIVASSAHVPPPGWCRPR